MAITYSGKILPDGKTLHRTPGNILSETEFDFPGFGVGFLIAKRPYGGSVEESTEVNSASELTAENNGQYLAKSEIDNLWNSDTRIGITDINKEWWAITYPIGFMNSQGNVCISTDDPRFLNFGQGMVLHMDSGCNFTNLDYSHIGDRNDRATHFSMTRGLSNNTWEVYFPDECPYYASSGDWRTAFNQANTPEQTTTFYYLV